MIGELKKELKIVTSTFAQVGKRIAKIEKQISRFELARQKESEKAREKRPNSKGKASKKAEPNSKGKASKKAEPISKGAPKKSRAKRKSARRISPADVFD